jgi:hypothetical protein
MDSTAEGNFFRRYWRTFLPLWLVPFPVLATSLMTELASKDFTESALPFVILAIIIYITIAEIWAMSPWRRGEITWHQSWILYAPLFPVALFCFFLNDVLLRLLRL